MTPRVEAKRAERNAKSKHKRYLRRRGIERPGERKTYHWRPPEPVHPVAEALYAPPKPTVRGFFAKMFRRLQGR